MLSRSAPAQVLRATASVHHITHSRRRCSKSLDTSSLSARQHFLSSLPCTLPADSPLALIGLDGGLVVEGRTRHTLTSSLCRAPKHLYLCLRTLHQIRLQDRRRRRSRTRGVGTGARLASRAPKSATSSGTTTVTVTAALLEAGTAPVALQSLHQCRSASPRRRPRPSANLLLQVLRRPMHRTPTGSLTRALQRKQARRHHCQTQATTPHQSLLLRWRPPPRPFSRGLQEDR